jgi:hypothetical protein
MNIKRFVKERDEMLKKCSIKELRKFVKKNAGKYYEEDFAKRFEKASDKVAEINLHKMIVNCTNLPIEFRWKSASWLMNRGYSLEV